MLWRCPNHIKRSSLLLSPCSIYAPYLAAKSWTLEKKKAFCQALVCVVFKWDCLPLSLLVGTGRSLKRAYVWNDHFWQHILPVLHLTKATDDSCTGKAFFKFLLAMSYVVYIEFPVRGTFHVNVRSGWWVRTTLPKPRTGSGFGTELGSQQLVERWKGNNEALWDIDQRYN